MTLRIWLACLLTAASLSGCTSLGVGTREIIVTDGDGGPRVAGVEVVTFSGFLRLEDRVMTDAQGRARIEGGARSVEIRAPGFVRETHAIDRDARVDRIPIYRDAIRADLDGQVSAGDVGTHDTPLPERWDPHEVPFGGTAEARRAYAARLLALNVSLMWNNTPTGAGDLAIGLGADTERALIWRDDRSNQVEMGGQSETVRLTIRDFGSQWQDADALFAGAGAGKAFVAPLGLSYRLVLEGSFGEPRSTHGWWLAPLAALAIGALMSRRRQER